jgi:hypothetical protein
LSAITSHQPRPWVARRAQAPLALDVATTLVAIAALTLAITVAALRRS